MWPEIDWGMIASGMPTPSMQPSFNDRFGAASPQGIPPSAPGAPPPGPLSPEHLASSAAARGVPPPPVDLAPQQPEPFRMPSPDAVQAWRDGVDQDMSKPGAVGAALTGKTVGAPMDIKSEAQKQDEASQGGPSDPNTKKPLDKFAESLKGLKAPAGPELQRLSTPAAPRPTNSIKGGDLIALLQSLNAAPGASSYNLPSTLGAALRR